MLEPKVDLYTIAIPPPRERDWRGNDFTSSPIGANSTVFASSPWALSHVSVTIKRSTPLYFINLDISQRLQAISLPFTDCALNEATMNECKFCLCHYCTKSYFNISVSKPSTLYRTVRNIANIDRPSFIAELCSVSEFSSVENANQFSDFLRTVLDKHAPPSLRKVITHSSSPWFESIRDELFIAKRERRQAERKWRNTKLAIFKDLYGQAGHKVSILVHTAKCKFYTERIALASSSKELHQIVNTLSNRHPPKT